MEKELWEQVYESLTYHISEPWRMPGIVDAFADGAYCMKRYSEMRDAYD